MQTDNRAWVTGFHSIVIAALIADYLVPGEQVGMHSRHIHQLTVIVLLFPPGFYHQGGIYFTGFIDIVVYFTPELFS